MSIQRRAVMAILATAAIAPRAFAQSAPMNRVRGTIAAVGGGTLTVNDRTGKPVRLAMAADTPILLISAAHMEDIKLGSFIGTAAMPQPDGTLMAMEIQVFPESMRGVGEGHRPWDLQPDSTMTNGTVGDVVGTSGRRLTLKYKGGEKTVVVPAEAPVITYEPGNPTMLVPGAHVIVFVGADADGTLRAQRIGVGKDGLVPPM